MPKHIPIDDRAVNASPSSYAAVLRSARPCCAVLYYAVLWLLWNDLSMKSALLDCEGLSMPP